WSWLFLLNIPLCGLLIVLILAGMRPERLHPHEFFRADWLGIAGLMLGLASLVIVLEQGQKENWFDSAAICWLTGLGLAGLAMIVVSQATTQHPVLKLRLLKRIDYAAVCLCSMIGGAGSFAGLYLVPTFLGAIAGYDAQQTGLV